jgi:hypothetical protein
MISNKDKIIKSNDKYLIINKNNKHIFKISQMAGTNLENEYNIIKQLRAKSKNYNKILPTTLVDKKKILSLGKFFYVQNYVKGLTFSKILSKKLNSKELNNLNKIKKRIYEISKENFNLNSDHTPLLLFTKLIINEFEIIKKKTHLSFLCENKDLIINNIKYKNFNYLLYKFLQSKKIKIVNTNKNYFSFLGHFNFHGENIIIENLKKSPNFFIIDPDSKWQCLDPMFSLARFFYTFDHDTFEKKKYIIKSNFFNLSKKKKYMFQINYMWKKLPYYNYRRILNKKNFFKYETNFYKTRFNLNYLLCLMRGINSNYDENIDFPSKKINYFRHSSIYLSLMAIKFLHELSFNE